MLEDEAPSGVNDLLLEAWETYAPLRAFLKDEEELAEINEVPETKISKDTLAAAAVFTPRAARPAAPIAPAESS